MKEKCIRILKMIKCLLVAVSEYAQKELNLPYCKNDLIKMHSSLIKGLKTEEKHIDTYGDNNVVTVEDFTDALEYKSYDLCEDDIFIFYFSGHGANGCICLSDNNYPIQNLIAKIDGFDAKAKIIILDCCHAGDFSLDKNFSLDIDTDLDDFTGSGIAVLASCKSNETSGFNDNNISVYTDFICDAINSKFINRNGKKSLEDIAIYVKRRSEIWNKRNPNAELHPIFRSFIGGTIYFDVELYTPYSVKTFYEENDEYIIYSVSPKHHALTKRYSVKIILKYNSDLSQISLYEKEIVKKLKHIEIHSSNKSERLLSGKPANIIWCYFGYDEDDMVDSNFICHTTWVDDTQDKEHWHHQSKNCSFINGTFFNVNTMYDSLKSLKNTQLNINEFIDKSRELTNRLISNGLNFVSRFREYENQTISEKQLVTLVKPIIILINQDYSELTGMDIPPKELHDWCQYQMGLAGDVLDFTLYFDEKTMNTWDQSSRIWLMKNTIKTFESDLEKYKKLDIDI